MKGAMFQETNTTLKYFSSANQQTGFVKKKPFGYNTLSYKDVVTCPTQLLHRFILLFSLQLYVYNDPLVAKLENELLSHNKYQNLNATYLMSINKNRFENSSDVINFTSLRRCLIIVLITDAWCNYKMQNLYLIGIQSLGLNSENNRGVQRDR